MPSPFPGMDPFIEGSLWGDFHSRFNNFLADALAPGLRPRYVARVEHRVVLERPDELRQDRYPDVGIFEKDFSAEPSGGGTATAVLDEPRTVTLPLPASRRLHYIEIRDRDSNRLVTLIETLSPSNKYRKGADRRTYHRKRDQILASDVSLVEIDLLRGGEPFEAGPDRPPEAYAVLVSPEWRRPQADLYAVPLLQRLPTIRVPLCEDDEPVALDLQTAVDTVYERADYSTIDYADVLDPPLPEAVLRLLSERLSPERT